MGSLPARPKVTLIIFTWNEAPGMREIMPMIKKEWYDQLIIVDGGSTDGTVEYAREHGYHLFRQQQKGPGAAFRESLMQATGDILVIFSPDGNSMPEKIPEVVAKMNEGYDLVIVSRYREGAKSDDDDLITAFGNWMFTTLINLLFRAGVTDSLVMFRAIRKSILPDLRIDSSGVSWGTEILVRAARRRLRIGEIPGDEPARIGGTRKMHPLKNGIAELTTIFKEFFRKG